MCVCFLAFAQFSPAAVGIFSRSRLRDTQGDRVNTTVQVWVPGGLRGACSGRPKSRNLASNREVVFRGARTGENNVNPHIRCFASLAVKALYFVVTTVCSVARALGVQSREIWQVIAGSLCAKLGPEKTM